MPHLPIPAYYTKFFQQTYKKWGWNVETHSEAIDWHMAKPKSWKDVS